MVFKAQCWLIHIGKEDAQSYCSDISDIGSLKIFDFSSFGDSPKCLTKVSTATLDVASCCSHSQGSP